MYGRVAESVDLEHMVSDLATWPRQQQSAVRGCRHAHFQSWVDESLKTPADTHIAHAMGAVQLDRHDMQQVDDDTPHLRSVRTDSDSFS